MVDTRAPKIAAVVSTFNRLAELEGCIAALRAQTRAADGIVVVDDGSTDETRVWLDTQGDLQVVHQDHRGEAAGFANGMKAAVAHGFDWVWCLDDDAHPTPTALEMLCRALDARPDARILNSLGVARSDATRFAVGALCVRTDFDNYLSGRNVTTRAELAPFADAHGIVDSIGGHIYHGIMIHRSIVESVGVPREAFVIKGDEVEYSLRLMRAGYHILAVTASIVKHPQLPTVSVQVFGKTKSFRPLYPKQRYYAIRNGIWIHRMYYPAHPFPYAMRRLAGGWVTDLWLTPNKSWRERLTLAQAALRGAWDGLSRPIPIEANVV